MPEDVDSSLLLVKRLGAFEVFTITAGTMIGAGIFVLPGILALKAGPASILSFVISGAIALCAALSVCELATAMPKSGGSYYFVSRAMGGMFGSIVGFGTLLALIFKGAFAFIGAGEYVHELISVAPVVTALALCALMVSLNISGTGVAGRFQNLIVSLLLVIFVVYILDGLFTVEFRRLEPFFRGTTVSFFEATGMVFITFLGVLKVTAVSEEVKNPARDLPLGIVSALGVVTLTYALVMMVTIGVLPIGTLAGSLAPIADAARIFAGRGGLVIIVIAGLMATLSTGNTALMSSGRYPFAMARDNLMPKWLAGIDHVVKTPARSILLVGFVTLILILFVDIENLVKLGSVFNLIVFILVNASVLLMRSINPKWYRPGFKAPLTPWTQIIGIAGCITFIPFMGIPSIAAAGLLILAGVAWFIFYGRGRASPSYRFRDVLRTSIDEEEARSAFRAYDTLSSHSWRLMVPVLTDSSPKNLLRIADLMSEEFDEKVHLVSFCRIPVFAYLGAEEIGGAIGPNPEDRIELPEGCSCSRFEYIDVCTTSQASAFSSIAKQTGADLAMLPLVNPDDRGEMRELKQMIKALPSDCAVYIDKDLKDIERILVAGAKPDDRLKLTVAGTIAKQAGASVTVLRIYPSRSQELSKGDLESRILKSGVMYGIPLEAKIARSDNVVETIASESKEFDLIIVGAGQVSNYSRDVFGKTVDEILKKVGCSAIVVNPAIRKKKSTTIRVIKRLAGSP